jgi:hypothetical protein
MVFSHFEKYNGAGTWDQQESEFTQGTNTKNEDQKEISIYTISTKF